MPLSSITSLAAPGDGLVHWSDTDKNTDISLSADKLGVSVTGTGHKGIRSNHSMAPGDGFYYFEATNLSGSGDYGFGIATSSASLDGVGGQDQNSLVISSTGGVYFDGNWLFSVPGNPSTYGIAVDYRGDFPLVHFIADTGNGSVEFLTTVILESVHEPVYIYMYASDGGAGEQQRLNLGSSTFAYDPKIGLELQYFNGANGLQMGWPLPDEAPTVIANTTDRVILAFNNTSFSATATDPEDGDLSNQIEWFLDGVFQGTSPTLTNLSLAAGTYTLEARVTDQWQQIGIASINITSIVSDTEDTDGDGLSYAQELNSMTDPAFSDTDSDGLSDGSEVNTYLTSPILNDHDGDGMTDGYEVSKGFNPLVNDSADDPDGDSFSNLAEFNAGSDPHSSADYPGLGHVGFNVADTDPSATISADGLKIGFNSGLAGARSDIAALPGSGWHYFEGTRLVNSGSIGFGVATALESLQVTGGGSSQSLVINTQGEVLYNGQIITTLANPDLVSTYGFAIDYSGSEPIVYILYKEAYGGDYQSLAPITMTGINAPLYIFAYGSDQGTTYSHQLNAGENPTQVPFKYPADYVLFQAGISSAEFMATGWGTDHAYITRKSVPLQSSVKLIKDDNTNRLLSLSNDGLAAAFNSSQKSAAIANQGMVGEFWYWEGKREVAPGDIGFGLNSKYAYKNPYCCVTANLNGAPPSMSINALGSGWRNLVWQFNWDVTNEYYGFAVDYRGNRPIVYVIMEQGVVGTLTLDDFITPIYPMIYGSISGPTVKSTVNFGLTPFYYNAKIALEEYGIDTTEFRPGWGIHEQNSHLGNGTNQPPQITISPVSTVFIPDSVILNATATDTEDGDISASVIWTDSFDGQVWSGASPERTLAFGSHLITASITDSDGNTTEATITIDVVQPAGPDSDFDGLVDSLEAYYGSDPNDRDSDNDGLTDFAEILLYGTNALLADSDGDLINDKDEVDYGLNPLVDDASNDNDADTFSNAAELTAGTDPLSSLSYPGGPIFDLTRVASIGTNNGNASWLNNTYTVSSNSTDNNGEPSDNYEYMYTRLLNDADVVVRVSQFTNNSSVAKAGIMLRADIAENSESAYVGITGGVGTFWLSRTPAGADRTDNYDYNGVNPPIWLRMVRSGNTITGYFGSDGINWTETGSVTMNLPPIAYIGLAVAGNSAGTEATVEFTDFNLTLLDSPPTVTISGGQSTLLIGETLLLNATALDPEDGNLSTEVNWLNSVTLEETTGISYSFSPLTTGAYTITSSITDSAAQSDTDQIIINVYASAGDLDEDEDGLSNDQESVLGTDPLDPDTDGDTLLDGDEVNIHGTDPTLVDSDGDTMPDNYELNNGFDPTLHDNSNDADNDGFSNIDEYSAGTDPLSQYDYPGAPGPELDMDASIGNNNGSANWLNGVYTLSSNSTDNSGTERDNYQYRYTTATSDIEIIAHINPFLAGAANVSKIGIMIRGDLTTNSQSVYMGFTSGIGSFWLTREVNSGSLNEAYDYNGIDPPMWIRLVREGDIFTGYWSWDGTTWNQTHSITIAMPQTVYIGLAAAGNSAGVEVSAEVSDLSITYALDTDGDGIPDNIDLDDDNDGIPDTVELLYGLDPLVATDASFDLDGDGRSNLAEYIDGGILNIIDTGDINGDNIVDLSDLLLLEQSLTGANSPDSNAISRADFNRDGALTIADLLLLQLELIQ